ncbi:MAG: hypothetical protein WCN95_00695 [bacterium]
MTARRVLLSVVCLVLSSTIGLNAQNKDLAWAVSQAPADALVVAGARNIKELWTNLKELSCQGDKIPDLLAVMEMSLPAGVDLRGAAVAILMPGQVHPDMVLMGRMKSGAALEGEKIEGGIIKVAAALGSATYMLKMDPWVVMSDNLASVKAISTATARLKITEQQRTDLNSRSIWAWVNTKALTAKAKAAIPKTPPADDTAAGGPNPTMIADWAVGLLNQVNSLTVAADIKTDAALLTVGLDYAPDSQLALIAASGTPMVPAKAGLAATDSFLLAGWGRMDWIKAIGPTKSILKPLFAAVTPASNKVARKSIDDLWAIYDEWAGTIGNEFAFIMEPAPAGEGTYRMTQTIAVKNPDAYRKLLAKTIPLSANLTKAFSAMGPMGSPSMEMTADYKPGAETIDGVAVDISKTKMAFSSPDMGPEEKEEAQKMMESIYGPEGMTMRMALLGRTAIVSMGGKETMVRAIKASKNQVPGLLANPKVIAALDRVPKDASFAGLISLPAYAHFTFGMITRMMAGAGAPSGQPAPVLGDLVTFSLRMQGTTQYFNLHVPQSEIKGLIKTIEQATGGMGGGVKKGMPMPDDSTVPPDNK